MMRRTPLRTPRSDSGTASLEMVIVAPFLLALLMLIVAFGRYAQTENLVDQASRDGARSATANNARSEVPDRVAAVVEEAMVNAPDSCRDSARDQVTMTSGAFREPDPNDLSAVDSVSVTVTCTVDMSDLAALPLRSVQISRTFTSPTDRYRGYR